MRHILITLSNAKHGRDTEFNEWYDRRHIGDMLGQEGFVAAQRFRLVETPDQADAPYRYLTIFEIGDDELDAARESVAAAPSNPSIVMTDARDDHRAAWWFTALGVRRTTDSPMAGELP